MVASLAALVTGCGGGSHHADTSTHTAPGVTLNSQDVKAAPTCSSLVGRVLKASDVNEICSVGGTVYPAGSTRCTNGLTYLTFGPLVGGVVGGKAAVTRRNQALDRATCNPI